MNLLATRKREHSRKPDELYPIIEACSPGPYPRAVRPRRTRRPKCSRAGSSNGYGSATRLVRHERSREIAQ